MSNLYTHTYWDGMKVERYSGRKRRCHYHLQCVQQDPRLFIGPEQPLKAGVRHLAIIKWEKKNEQHESS